MNGGSHWRIGESGREEKAEWKKGRERERESPSRKKGK